MCDWIEGDFEEAELQPEVKKAKVELAPLIVVREK